MMFATPKQADAIIAGLYPQAQRVQFVEHGYDNLVVLIDETFALRFPRHAGASARSQYEALLLQDLEHYDFGSIAIPRLLGSHDDPPYLITSFIAGHALTPTQLGQLPRPTQQEFAEDVAQFAFGMHNALPVDRVMELRERFGLEGQKEEPWDVYFKKLLYNATLPIRQQDTVAKDYYEKWSHLEFTTNQVVVHDDLHTENMLFQGNRLGGVLDFGDTNVGTPEQELRQLYRINATITEQAAVAYGKLLGQHLNLEAIRIWAITQELSAYAERLSAGMTDHHAFRGASYNLNQWFETDIWGKGIISAPRDAGKS